jgi:NAD(P)-dependent dehydrogenase (short-subunit alcohol dehydrogenase family)
MPSVLITGANRGLGLEFARQYEASGYRVFATARDVKQAEQLQALAKRPSQGRITVHTLEVADGDSVAALARELAGEPLDILLNNAGTMGPKQQGLDGVDYAGMLDTLSTNTIAPLRLAQALLENVASSERKLIVAVTSGMGSIAETSGGHYAYRASKAALNMTYRNLALDLKPRGIITAVINPGWVQTDMGGAGAPLQVDESIRKMRKVFDELTLAQTGSFLNFSGGTLPW